MLMIILLAVGIPSLLGIASAGLRKRRRAASSDRRGIALQTVIIMVVLLVIAGGVAAVLLSRGGEAVADLERQDITVDASSYTNRVLCLAAGYSWSTAAATTTCVSVP